MNADIPPPISVGPKAIADKQLLGSHRHSNTIVKAWMIGSLNIAEGCLTVSALVSVILVRKTWETAGYSSSGSVKICIDIFGKIWQLEYIASREQQILTFQKKRLRRINKLNHIIGKGVVLWIWIRKRKMRGYRL